MKKILILVSALCFQTAFVQAEVVVVGNPSLNATLTSAEVKNLFLGKRQSLPDGTPITIVERTAEAPLKSEFHSKYTNKSEAQLSAYWTRLVFTGKGKPPKEISNSDELINMISSNPNFIGYIDSTEVTDKVSVLSK